MRTQKRQHNAISKFHGKLLRLIDKMEVIGHLLFYDIDEGRCCLTVNKNEASVATIKQYFPQAELCSSGGGTVTYKVPEFDGSIPDGYRGEAIVDEARRFHFVDGAQWVQIAGDSIFVWHGDDRIEMYELNGLGHMAMLLEEKPSLELVQRKIAEHCR